MRQLGYSIERIASHMACGLGRVWYSDLNPMRRRLPPGEPFLPDDPMAQIVESADSEGSAVAAGHPREHSAQA